MFRTRTAVQSKILKISPQKVLDLGMDLPCSHNGMTQIIFRNLPFLYKSNERYLSRPDDTKHEATLTSLKFNLETVNSLRVLIYCSGSRFLGLKITDDANWSRSYEPGPRTETGFTTHQRISAFTSHVAICQSSRPASNLSVTQTGCHEIVTDSQSYWQ